MNCVLVCLRLGLSETRKMYGVRCLIRKAWKNNITNFTGISEQVAYLKMKFEYAFE